MRDLTPEILTELGFERDSWENDDREEEVIWVDDTGITLFENPWSTPTNYNFASRTREDGSFKSGWVIKTDGQVLLLRKALRGE